MKNRFFVIAGLALAASTVTPAPAQAVVGPCLGSVTLGFGGYFDGCWGGFNVSRLFENAGNINNISWFAGMPARATAQNTPTPGGTFLFNNNCGSNGNTAASGLFCTPMTAPIGPTIAELVFGLQNPSGVWIYTGTDPNRNSPPIPAGVQNFLWEITDNPGTYLLGWEDLNSGCLGSGTSAQITTGEIDTTIELGALFAACNPGANPGGSADNDYNDFYMLIQAIPDTPTEVVPEPMTMSLLATGLAALGGASLRRRRNK